MKNDEKNKNTAEEEGTVSEPAVEEAEAAEQPDEKADETAELLKSVDEYKDKLLRLTAEFDNYRKRTTKEKESLYSDGMAECASKFLGLTDNMSRCQEAFSAEPDDSPLKKGVELIIKQLNSILEDLDIKEIPAVGEPFNPELHNAVMHVDDESYDQAVVVEEFQKGYIMKGKVLRFSMVKVAN